MVIVGIVINAVVGFVACFICIVFCGIVVVMVVCMFSGCPVSTCPDGKCSHTVLGCVPQVGVSHSQVVPEVCRTGLCQSVGMVQVIAGHREECGAPEESGCCTIDDKSSAGM